jgi:H2-forming N5,N10-methylenetetrahydromethanopterin dehydrogenase-like enzyme
MSTPINDNENSRIQIVDSLLFITALHKYPRRTLHLAMTLYDVYSKTVKRIPSKVVAYICFSLATIISSHKYFDVDDYYESLVKKQMARSEDVPSHATIKLLTDAIVEKIGFRLCWRTLPEEIVYNSYRNKTIDDHRCVDKIRQDLLY